MVNVVKVKTFSLDSVMGSKSHEMKLHNGGFVVLSNVGDAGVSSVAKACASSLKTLKLLDCYKVGDESISSLAQF
ncbi:hypothetical protein Bca4012_099236 [Brassica carinata]